MQSILKFYAFDIELQGKITVGTITKSLLAQAQKAGDSEKILANLNKKTQSFTPLSCNVKFIILTLKDSAAALYFVPRNSS
ncbi:hypothetical protein [Chryseobacterium lathyri]|uniref:Uncharacterized protein n=1 Tax=Chryseobacterium lathyri TaxID=395933 RepID=A0A511YFV5_9FLAO|nr:hypothetical protein [Chryseobacterium lathyri]GEN74061.1 hypothetical protein CLA01_41330 [Chryseobacterium lathyri]